MDALNYVGGLLLSGFMALIDYLSFHVLLCLVPAFFIAGAITALFNKETVLKYLGPNTRPLISYPVAALGGLLLAVCSCTILPLFSGIWKKGAGLGPAVTFLFTGPAINLLAIVLTGQLIGWDVGLSRAFLAVFFGIIIGYLMMVIFEKGKKKDPTKGSALFETSGDEKNSPYTIGLFVLLMGILVAGTFPFTTIFGGDGKIAFFVFNLPSAFLMAGFSVQWALRYNTREENSAWLNETWYFFKTIMPLLLIGVFVAGMLKFVIPEAMVVRYVGDDSLWSILAAVLFGIFMYFPTLVEVPIARLFLDLGMSKTALLAYLLAAPGLSIQSILVIRKVMGNGKTAAYVGLVALFCVLAGLIFGFIWT
ncbi:MAG TPA: permease [Euryarchaeota archaeon]|nr:permease [Euryarchaeota archaeon]